MTTKPLITVAVPSFNQGRFLEEALQSLLRQELPIEVFVMDGGSTDGSIDIIRALAPDLAGWRSRPDEGQASAINEAIACGTAPYVTWLNSDDIVLDGGMAKLVAILERQPEIAVVYGRAQNLHTPSGARSRVWVQQFSERRLASRCIISQPAALMRRSAWEGVGGLDPSLRMAMDYDLWWRLHQSGFQFRMIPDEVAVNRIHPDTKTRRNRTLHYREAMRVVGRHYGRLPLKWWLALPYAVVAKSVFPFLP